MAAPKKSTRPSRSASRVSSKKAASQKSTTKKPAASRLPVTANTAKVAASPSVSNRTKPRMLRQQVYKSFRLHKRIKTPGTPPPTVTALIKQTYGVIKERPVLFLGIVAVHLILTLTLVRGFSSNLDLAGTQEFLSEFYGEESAGGATAAFSLLGQLISGSGGATTNAGAGAYQSIIAIVTTLAVIWAARQKGGKVPIRVRDAFYRGMYPLVPFVLILLLIGLQFLPVALGGWLYSAVIAGGIAVTALEKMLWGSLVILLLILSLYMITSSVFALFIVTLPDMTPMRALRSARNLVQHRRWAIAAKVVAMIIILFMALGLIMLPYLLWLPAAAEAVYVVVSAFGLIIPVVYLYNLYYGLLK